MLDRYIEELEDKVNYYTEQLAVAKKYEYEVVDKLEAENNLARYKVLLSGMKHWAELTKTGEVQISNYFNITFFYNCGIVFYLTSSIMEDLRKYLYLPYSDSQFTNITNKGLVDFLSPAVDNNYLFEDGGYSLRDITSYVREDLIRRTAEEIEHYKYEEKLIKMLDRTVEKLTSNEVKPFLEMIENYIDALMAKNKKVDD